MDLDGPDAFGAISAVLRGEREANNFSCREGTPAERLRQVLANACDQTGIADVAILIRHTLREEDLRRHLPDAKARFRIKRGGPLDHERVWALAGIESRNSSQWVELTAHPWKPDWLPDTQSQPVDETTCAAHISLPRREFTPENEHDDPFLETFGFKSYRSKGQRSAVRSALLTPPGSVLVVDLPTSDGKSLVFRAIDSLGFASDDVAKHGKGGVTLVVVPTVALALDHQSNCATEGTEKELAYIGGAQNRERNQKILERVREGTQGLCFAAPEAAVGPMRWSLVQAARSGSLRAIVVDEAHLIDAWGTGFRTEFQQLAGLRLELLESSPLNNKPRTLLLSATFSASTHETLNSLFSTPTNLEVVSAPQVRPEPEYWISPTVRGEVRDQHVLEALYHVPRPAILYVTKVADANRWFHALRTSGFQRIGCITGDTRTKERSRVLDGWRNGEIDLVVATSAFGLGVDYLYVRSILHACVPESLDRFYQEVGRSGRDGRAALSLLMPAVHDIRLARDLSNRVIISIDRGLQRWTKMFQHPERKQIKPDRFLIRLDIAPGYTRDDIDMLSGRNSDWNARTLVLMVQSGLIRFCSQVTLETDNQFDTDVDDEDEDVNEASPIHRKMEAVEIVVPSHLLQETWEQKVAPVRAKLLEGGQFNLELLSKFLKRNTCPADLIARLYGDSVSKICGGCPLCRKEPSRRKDPDLRSEPKPPWTSALSLSDSLAGALAEGRLVIFYDPEAQGRRANRLFREIFSGLVHHGIRWFGVLGHPSSLIDSGIASLSDCPVFVGRGETTFECRFPDVSPRVLIYCAGIDIESTNLRPVDEGAPRFLFVPVSAPSVDRSDLQFRDTWNGPATNLEQFHARIGL